MVSEINRTKLVKFAVFAIVAAICLFVEQSQAQKTSRNTFQQTLSSGSNQQSVYGGYQASQPAVNQQRKAPAANQQRRTQQTYVSRPRAEPAPRQQPEPVYQQQEQQQQQQQEQLPAASSYSDDQQAEADAEPASYGAVQGKPGKDFPNYTQVPKTSFSCDGLPYDYGMYADEETGCQAYHVCYNGRKDSFLCGVGTVFNQRILHCDYWYSVDCAKSSQYYSSNAYMGSSQPEPGPAQASGSSNQGSYERPKQVAQSPANNRPANNYQAAQSSNSFSRNTQQQQIQEAY